METELSITLRYSGDTWDVVIHSDDDNQEAKERVETIVVRIDEEGIDAVGCMDHVLSTKQKSKLNKMLNKARKEPKKYKEISLNAINKVLHVDSSNWYAHFAREIYCSICGALHNGATPNDIIYVEYIDKF